MYITIFCCTLWMEKLKKKHPENEKLQGIGIICEKYAFVSAIYYFYSTLLSFR